MRIKRSFNGIFILMVTFIIFLIGAAGIGYYISAEGSNSAESDKLTISKESYVRTGPDETYPSLTTLYSGDKILQISKLGDWVEVKTENDYVGWVPGWTISGSGVGSPEDLMKERLANYTIIINKLNSNSEKNDYLGKSVDSYNIEIINKLKEILKKDNINVIYTGENNTILTSDEIKSKIKDNNVAMILDLDMGVSSEGKFGVSMYYSNTNTIRLASYFEKNLSNNYIQKINSAEKIDNYSIYSEDVPQIKILSGNINDKVDVDILRNTIKNNQYVSALNSGIKEYLYYLIKIEMQVEKQKEQLLNSPQKGLSIPLYYTKGDKYKNISYGLDGAKTIESNGDIIVSLFMIDKYLNPEGSTSLQDIASWAGNKYYVKNQGTNSSIITDFAKKYNFNVEKIKSTEFEKIESALKDNKPVIARFNTGLFGSKVTYKVIRGIEDDKYYINDPDDDDKKLNSYTGFTKNDIEKNILEAWAMYK